MMCRFPASSFVISLLGTCAGGILLFTSIGADTPRTANNPSAASPSKTFPTPREARERARLLHETMHSLLHKVHHELYRPDEGLTLPAALFKQTFEELEKNQQVTLRWLVVNGQAMNVDHNPKTPFDQDAIRALTSGQEEYDVSDRGVYRYAGAINLASQCLKCHLPQRTSTDSRLAALVISMPLAP